MTSPALTGVILLAESSALPAGAGTIGELVDVVDAAVAGGIDTVIVRDKHRSSDERRELVAAVRDVVRRRREPRDGRGLVLVALDELGDALGADGVHLSAHGAARCHERGGRADTNDGWLGVSTHDVAAVERAVAVGADYVTASPVYTTESKPGYGPPLGPDSLAAFVRASPIAVVALGGITTTEAVTECREAGAAGVAVMGALLRAGDPEAVAASLVAPYLEGSPGATPNPTPPEHFGEAS